MDFTKFDLKGKVWCQSVSTVLLEQTAAAASAKVRFIHLLLPHSRFVLIMECFKEIIAVVGSHMSIN